jgi:hypothetical protein
VFTSLCSTLGYYHDLYLLLDTLLLACVFENFREVAMKNYKLDPCHYFSLAGYAWDGALLATGQKLEQITDPKIYNIIEMGLRGGVSMISTRHATANNKYMDNYSKNEKDRFLLYIDKNNLYGEALCQHLPVSNFEFESREFVKRLSMKEIKSWKPDDTIGRILMVDLEYPDKLHYDTAHDDGRPPLREVIQNSNTADYVVCPLPFHDGNSQCTHLKVQSLSSFFARPNNEPLFNSQQNVSTESIEIERFEEEDCH